jgi:hypothetical protein
MVVIKPLCYTSIQSSAENGKREKKGENTEEDYTAQSQLNQPPSSYHNHTRICKFLSTLTFHETNPKSKDLISTFSLAVTRPATSFAKLE